MYTTQSVVHKQCTLREVAFWCHCSYIM